jgi:glycine dehydrogenase
VIDEQSVGLSFGEPHTVADLVALLDAFGVKATAEELESSAAHLSEAYGSARTTPFMTHPIFNHLQSETEMMRYLKK